ncbi:pilus assembly protein PilP [Salinibius halmophilus]|uniref:pilus assembly protein PilP n=1 Tax=Salinibius halmophilus TaxID=1853216 RepID=UPI000E66A5E0|nr:pilus assembly protein PilP [Salinibius halmophilus]
MKRLVPAILTLSAVSILSGCAETDISDLQAYSREVQTLSAPPVKPLPEFPEPIAYQYQSFEDRSPFMPKQSVADIIQSINSQGVRPDSNRAKEPLEDYRIESLRMVGTIALEGGALEALVLDPSGIVHSIRRGNYLGQNNGRVVGINETQLELREIVPNGQGGWIERPRTVSMAEQ